MMRLSPTVSSKAFILALPRRVVGSSVRLANWTAKAGEGDANN
jgi:hypothetical protein